jgi:hypothetical protein
MKKGTEPVEAEKSKPTLHLEDSDIIEGLTIDDEVTLTVKAKLVGMNKDKWDGKEHKSQRFEIVGLEKQKITDKERIARKSQNKGF